MATVSNIQVNLPTAPELIQDLLAADGGALSVGVICRAGELTGIGESAIRVALNRLTEQGKITRSARGFYAMNAQFSALAQVVDDWKHETDRTIPWDETWLAVHDTMVLRSDKTEWRHHNLALSLCGFRQFQPGLHIRPNNLTGGVTEIRARLQELGLSAQSLVFHLDQLDADRQARAKKCWDVVALAQEYRQIRQALKSSTQGLKKMDLDGAVRESLLLGRAVISKLIRDPLLPTEIAPVTTRQDLTNEMKRYHADALQFWNRWLKAG